MKNLIYLFLFLALTISLSAQWSSDIRMTNDPQLSYTSFGNARCIAASGNIVHIVWYSGDTVGVNGWEIFYNRSADKGLTWGTPVRLSNAGTIMYNPAIAVSGSTVHVVWYEKADSTFQQMYRRSIDGGLTWEDKRQLTFSPARTAHSSIFAAGLNVYLAWMDYRHGNFEIYFNKSADGGITWGTEVRISNNSGPSRMPAITVSGTTVHVAWEDSSAGNFEIYYKRSLDNGVTWGAETRMTNDPANTTIPSLAVSGNTVHLIFMDYRPGYPDTYYRRSTNNGTTWSSEIRIVKGNSSVNYYPSMAVEGSSVHVVYTRYVSGWQIFYNNSVNAGVSWAKKDIQISNIPSPGTPYNVPSIAALNGNLHVIWRDTRDGNWEIYYDRNVSSQSNPLAVSQLNSEIPNSYSLSQNYPNPFNPSTVISYQLVVNSFVTLKVFDNLGREIETLIDGQLKPGTYQVKFDGTNYPSGVYYYKLIAGDFVETKKMSLIK